MKTSSGSIITFVFFGLAINVPAQQEQPSMQIYSKYDFTPGEKVIFYDDFSEVAVGDFPASWNTNATGEVVRNFGIDASRLESDGMGESKPVVPNDTPVNKALNRRVEFIKI